MSAVPNDYLIEWVYLHLTQPIGFAAWWDLLDQALVNWQLDQVQRLLGEAKRAPLSAEERARVYHGEGRFYSQLGDWTRAVNSMITAVDLLEDTEYVEEGIALLLDLGMALRIQGNQAGAKAAHEQALLLACEIERTDLEAEALEQIGLNLDHTDDPKAALNYYQQALDHWQTLAETEPMIHTLNHIGDAQRSVGELDSARITLEHALQLAQNLPDKAYVQAQIRGNLGCVHYERGDLAEAETQWLAALTAFDALGVIFDKIGVLNNLGGLAVQWQQTELALDYFGRSITLAEAIGDQRGLKTALTNMAIVLRDSGQVDITADDTEQTD